MAWVGPVAVAVVAGLLYGIDAAGNLEIFYAAADRSMALSWHNFFFAAFDPAATITIDKLPGALWPQALSVRMFGPHPWAVVAPQVIEGIAAVLVMFRVMTRLLGRPAAVLAAGIFALSPAVVALDRGNVPDTLMILLLLLAADAALSAARTGRWRPILLAGLWIGLAFQAKMMQAWVVAPAIGGVFLVGGPGGLRDRTVRTAAMAGVTVVVSLSWMAVVSLVGAGSRPYVDGSTDDSIFAQVFVYNGFGRIDAATPNQVLGASFGTTGGPARPVGFLRLLTGPYGLLAGWLIPLALLCLIGLAVYGKGRSRRDPLRLAVVLWGGWLVLLFAVFSFGAQINSYYLAALAPPVAGLVAAGLTLAWRHREARWTRGLSVVAVGLTVGYAMVLLPASGVGLPAGLRIVVGVLGAAAIGLLWVNRRVGVAVAAAACLFTPTVAAVSITVHGLGPFDVPFESPADAAIAREISDYAAVVRPGLSRLEQVRGSFAILAAQSSAVASPYIFDTGEEVLPIGGFDSTAPSPTLAALQHLVQTGGIRLVVQSPTSDDPRMTWIREHCNWLPTTTSRSTFALYDCR